MVYYSYYISNFINQINSNIIQKLESLLHFNRCPSSKSICAKMGLFLLIFNHKEQISSTESLL